jgi:FkbM family methyltransferase
MVNLFTVYKKYPYRIPARVRFFNIFRYLFTIRLFENLLVRNLSGYNSFWRRLIPPVYLYSPGSMRTAERDGIKFRLDLSRLLEHSAFFKILNEPAWQNLFKNIKPEFVVFDIGANIGFLTLNFARICHQGRVVAFEPDSRNFESLEYNLTLNDFTNIQRYKLALGSRQESRVLYKLIDSNPGANRILGGEHHEEYPHEKVNVMTLDRMVEELSLRRLDLLKIDVEGFEMFVLQGAEESIKKWQPILFVELAEVNLNEHGLSARQLIEYIEQLNYEALDARTMEKIDRSKPDHHADLICFFKP